MNQALITHLNLCDECGFARVILDGLSGAYSIKCAGSLDDFPCTARTATFKTPEQAQTAWNKKNMGIWDAQPLFQKSNLLKKTIDPDKIVISGNNKQNFLSIPYELIQKYGLESLEYYYMHIVPGKPLAKIYFINEKNYNRLNRIRLKKGKILKVRINSTLLIRRMDISTIIKNFEIWYQFEPAENCFRLSFALLKELQGKNIPSVALPKKQKPLIQSKPESISRQSQWAEV